MDLIMVLMGWLAHHATLLYRINTETGKILSPKKYIKTRPYKFALSIFGTVMGTIIIVAKFQDSGIDDATYLMMLAGVGFGCDMVADQLGKFTFSKMK
ncbi:MAG: hypothetical protein OEX12_07030 [Gammaproteobacteria bacterium]|nr:hypothetical protein [Gammaproteobacteria bacterium]